MRLRYVGGLPPTRDQDSADPRSIVAHVEGKPAPLEKDFKPRAEIRSTGRSYSIRTHLLAEISRRLYTCNQTTEIAKQIFR
jgi:hypothetical protein